MICDQPCHDSKRKTKLPAGRHTEKHFLSHKVFLTLLLPFKGAAK